MVINSKKHVFSSNSISIIYFKSVIDDYDFYEVNFIYINNFIIQSFFIDKVQIIDTFFAIYKSISKKHIFSLKHWRNILQSVPTIFGISLIYNDEQTTINWLLHAFSLHLHLSIEKITLIKGSRNVCETPCILTFYYFY